MATEPVQALEHACYSEGYAAAVVAGRAGPRLAGAATAPWDDRLPAEMRDAGVSVPEEAVLGELLGDLMGED